MAQVKKQFNYFGFFLIVLSSSLLNAQEAKYLLPPKLPTIPQKSDFEVYVDCHARDSDAENLIFSSVEAAVQAIQNHQKEAPKDSVAIIFKSAPIVLKEPILLENIHGTLDNPVVIKSENEKIVLHGNHILQGSANKWAKLNQSPFFQNKATQLQAETLKKRIKPDFFDKIYVATLNDFGVTNIGDATELGKRPEFFLIRDDFTAIPQTLARFPDEGFLKAGKVYGKTKIDSWNGPGYREGIFEYLEENPIRWTNEPDARLFGYWFWDWAESYAKIESIDPDLKTIKIDEPYHSYGYKDGFRYYAVNLLAELDSPGEYYIDRENKLIFWFPTIEDPNAANTKTTLSVFDASYMLEIKNCSNLILSDFHFCYGRQNAIKIESSDHCLINQCLIYGFGKDAIHINGGSENGIYATQMECLGAGGVTINGGDRKQLAPCNHFVENNRISGFSRLKRTYAPAILARGCGIRIAHNEIAQSSSSAMRLEGNDMLVEFNRVRNVVEESDDQGGIDSWYNPSFRGIVIRYNYWGDIVGGTHCGAAGIRLDDMISGFKIYGNVFERCGAIQFGAIQIHGGKDNLVENNLFLNCFAAVSFSRWGDRYLNALEGTPESLDKSPVLQKIYEEVDIRLPHWQEKYPELAKIKENPDVNIIQNNLVVNCKNLFLRDGNIQKATNNIELTLENPTVLSIINDGLLEKNAIKPIPFEQFGNLRF